MDRQGPLQIDASLMRGMGGMMGGGMDGGGQAMPPPQQQQPRKKRRGLLGDIIQGATGDPGAGGSVATGLPAAASPASPVAGLRQRTRCLLARFSRSRGELRAIRASPSWRWPLAHQAFAPDVLDPGGTPRIVGIIGGGHRRRLVEKLQAVAGAAGGALQFGKVGEARAEAAMLVLAGDGDGLPNRALGFALPARVAADDGEVGDRRTPCRALSSPRSRAPMAMARSSSGAASPNLRRSSRTRARLFMVVAKSGWSGPSTFRSHRDDCRENSAPPRAGRAACRRSARAS